LIYHFRQVQLVVVDVIAIYPKAYFFDYELSFLSDIITIELLIHLRIQMIVFGLPGQFGVLIGWHSLPLISFDGSKVAIVDIQSSSVFYHNQWQSHHISIHFEILKANFGI
jgi:hypothetical protein